MPNPIRFVACTFNLWYSDRWPERRESMKKFLELHRPDLLCVQELRPATRELIDEVFTTHQRVEDPHEGWLKQGNIWWHAELFEKVAHGAADNDMAEEGRWLFWTRLKFKHAAPTPTLLVATAHYYPQNRAQEKETGLNPRLGQARKTVELLNALARPDEPVLFMGDLNDPIHPLRVLSEGGFVNSFAALRRQPKITCPAFPTSWGTPKAYDWVVQRGPIYPMACDVVDFFHEELAPSDHKPVLVAYRVGNA